VRLEQHHRPLEPVEAAAGDLHLHHDVDLVLSDADGVPEAGRS
jgi:hypothetical protein